MEHLALNVAITLRSAGKLPNNCRAIYHYQRLFKALIVARSLESLGIIGADWQETRQVERRRTDRRRPWDNKNC